MMGLEYWQSLDQLAQSPETIERLGREFPDYNPDQLKSLSRRSFMKLMSASMALAGLTLSGCRRWPKEQLAPYSANPRQRIPGVPEQYATVYEVNGVGHGLLVTTYDGRPIKVEGNPSHPFAQTFDGRLGAADAFAQASVLELYDPHRSRSVIDRTGKRPTSAKWEDFVRAIEPLRGVGGRGFAILSEKSSSPSVLAMRQRLMQVYPQAAWYEYEPLSHINEQAALGGNVRTQLHLDRADVIVSLDADILGTHPAHLRYAADWAKRRRSADSHGGMSRMYVVESSLTLTGAAADERLAAKPSRIPLIAAAITSANTANLNPDEAKFVTHVLADVKRNGVVVAGEHLPVSIHHAAHAINSLIGAYGKTVDLVEDTTPAGESINKLCEQIKSNGISTLLILGGNPAYDAPAELDFGKLLDSVPNSIHLSLYENETAVRCKWQLPRAHYLESWGDARAWDGLVSIQQPLILPLFDGKSVIEVLAILCNDTSDGRAIVKRTFTTLTGNDSETAFRRVLHDGILPDSQFKAATAKPQAVLEAAASANSGFEIRFVPDRKVLDGRFATNGWLQELPDPLTKLTWDNAALISTKDADTLGVTTGDIVRIGIGQRSLEIAAYILPGQPIGVIGLPLGYGRKAAGAVGSNVGFNAYSIRTSDTMDTVSGATITRTGATYALAQTQEHHIIDPIGFEGRQERVGHKGHSGRVVHDIPLVEFEKSFEPAGEIKAISLPILNPPHAFDEPHAWGMAVDMNACIGCSGCVIACQAENNIPIVGKQQVINGREMHWLRIDRYFKGEMDDPNPDLVYQPMMCVQCENAPCEQVCPVGATVHDTEGINTMVYNRCIGTRYCSNNCPYKVRRFNYFDWHSKAETNLNGAGKPWLGMPDSQQQLTINDIKKMVFNPEVTVRMRGVMEKCTYCVQRIHTTQTAKRNAGEEPKDGDIVTACQQACPTEAIVFGDLNDPNSKVSKLHQNKRAYSVLDDLNTKPRTKHMAKLRNPSGI